MNSYSGDFYKSISGPVENADLRVISLGVGVQSSVMSLMADRGMIASPGSLLNIQDVSYQNHPAWDALITQMKNGER